METPIVNSKKRICFWLTDQISASHREFALELGQKNFDIQFFGSLELLVNEVRTRRPAVIIIGDEGYDQLVEKAILTITNMPDISGARLVMTLSKNHEGLKRFAACSSFRDLIPMNLDKNQWIQRFCFAVSSSDSAIPKPPMLISMNSIATVNAPARVVWITKDRIWLECKLKPHKGASIQIAGPLAQNFGVSSLSASVVETRSSKLSYRFSDALVAEWQLSADSKALLDKMLDELHQIDAGPKCRVFAAIQDSSLRASLLKQLDILQFEVTTALHKMSVVEEPKFFSPNIVFIEDHLCLGEHQMRFFKMLANLEAEVPVVILGTKIKSDEAQKFSRNRKIFVLPRITQNFQTLLWARYLPKDSRSFKQRIAEGAIYISSDHLYSIANINFPARITKLHPTYVQLSIPFPMSTYGTIQLQSPLMRKLLNRDPYAKGVEVHENKDPASLGFSFRVSCVLSDVTQAEQIKMAEALIRSVNTQFMNAPHTVIKSIGQAPLASYTEDAKNHYGSTTPVTNIDSEKENVKKDSTDKNPSVLSLNPNSNRSELNASEILVPSGSVHTKAYLSNREYYGREHNKIHPNTTQVVSISSLNKTKNKKSLQSIRYALGFLAFTGGALALLWLISAVAATHWQKSGGQYTESLKKFAPQKFESPMEGAKEEDVSP